MGRQRPYRRRRAERVVDAHDLQHGDGIGVGGGQVVYMQRGRLRGDGVKAERAKGHEVRHAGAVGEALGVESVESALG